MDYPSDTAVIVLSRPYTLNGAEVTELVMHEPTLKDKILFSKDTAGAAIEQESRMIARLLNVDAADLNNLPACDYLLAVETFNDFLLPPADRAKPTSST